MASRVPDPVKTAEAKEELEAGKKLIATSILKWKADWLGAEPRFKAAARLFKSGGMHDSSIDAYRRAAQCSQKLGNFKQASLTLEQAAKESSLVPGGKETAAELFAEAAMYLMESGADTVRASDLRFQAGKQLESVDRERAARFYDLAAEAFDGQDDKDVYVVQPLQKIFREQLAVGKHASAMRTLDRLMAVYTRLKQDHNVTRAILTRVVLLLAAADPIAAQREFEHFLGVSGFAASADGIAAEDMLNAYSDMNVDAMKKVVERNTINYLDQPVAKLAKALPSVMLSGSQVGVAHSGEAASHGVARASAAGAPGPGGLRTLGEGGSATTVTPTATGATSRASEQAYAASRNELFARPTRSAGGSGEPDVVSIPGKVAGKATATAPLPADSAEDYDYASAFAAMGGVEDDAVAELPAAVESPNAAMDQRASRPGVFSTGSAPAPAVSADGEPSSTSVPVAEERDELGLW